MRQKAQQSIKREEKELNKLRKQEAREKMIRASQKKPTSYEDFMPTTSKLNAMDRSIIFGRNLNVLASVAEARKEAVGSDSEDEGIVFVDDLGSIEKDGWALV